MTMESIPVIKVGPVLLVSVQFEMNDRAATQMQEAILARIEETSPSGLLLDISAISVVDTFVARVITDTAAMASVMNTQTVLVGMMPEVAVTLTEMGLSLPDLKTALTVETGLAALGYRFEKIAAPEVGDAVPESLPESAALCH